jgi:V8-like Glu-specific endopeptidase
MKSIAVPILILSIFTTGSFGNDNVRWVLETVGPVSTIEGDEARPGRELSVKQLPPDLSDIEAFGTAGHPFTTSQVSVESGITPADSPPFNATGKLFMTFDGEGFVCTASVIGRSLLVTAAHCVHEFGQKDEGFPSALSFEPARHRDMKPFGTWVATEVWIPKSYYDGTDPCSDAERKVVCENDLALVVMEENGGKGIGEVVARYAIPTTENFGFVRFASNPSAQFTQLGYPSKDFDGLAMIRTDSIGIQQDPNTVVIGSNQTGGSSGGPWLQNFGTKTSHYGTAPTDGRFNVVTAVTSWGFGIDTVKLQGASRFSRNSVYTEKSNIQSLHDSVCAVNPDAC